VLDTLGHELWVLDEEAVTLGLAFCWQQSGQFAAEKSLNVSKQFACWPALSAQSHNRLKKCLFLSKHLLADGLLNGSL
jgi:hypothetical protein